MYNEKSFHLKKERLTEILQAVRCHILWLYLYLISFFLKPSLDNKMSIFRNKELLNVCSFTWCKIILIVAPNGFWVSLVL